MERLSSAVTLLSTSSPTEVQPLAPVCNPTREDQALFASYVDKLTKIYPAESYAYIGIGASCDVLLEYIKLRRPDITIATIPLSKANAITASDLKKTLKTGYKRVQNFIAHSVGEAILSDGGKKLLVMDVTDGGTSLLNAGRLLGSVLKKGGEDPARVQMLSLNEAPVDIAVPTEPVALGELTAKSRQPKDMMQRRLLTSDEQGSVVKAYVGWRVDPFKPKRYAPVLYDRFGESSPLGKLLYDEAFKQPVGRIYRKVPLLDVAGSELAPEEITAAAYDKVGHARIRDFVTKLLTPHSSDLPGAASEPSS